MTIRPVPKPVKAERGTQAARRHMAAVASLPCVICRRPPPSIVHHCIHDRFSQSRAGDFETIPLCFDHHDATSPTGLHHAPAAWRAQHGPDHSYLPAVAAAISQLQELML